MVRFKYIIPCTKNGYTYILALIMLVLIMLCSGHTITANESSNLIRTKDELKEVKLLLNWKHQFQFAGYYAAIHKGFYEDLGLKGINYRK